MPVFDVTGYALVTGSKLISNSPEPITLVSTGTKRLPPDPVGRLLVNLTRTGLPFLAMIIGPTMELAFRQSLMRSGGSFSIFVQSPIAVMLITASAVLFGWNIYRALRPKKASWEKALEEDEA